VFKPEDFVDALFGTDKEIEEEMNEIKGNLEE
jgi:hypothetical protein